MMLQPAVNGNFFRSFLTERVWKHPNGFHISGDNDVIIEIECENKYFGDQESLRNWIYQRQSYRFQDGGQ